MSIVFLPMNGIGLGHLARAFVLAKAMQQAGEAPVIFSQGLYLDLMAKIVPGTSVGTLYKFSKEKRKQITQEIQVYARRTAPAVVIEDTYPAPIHFEPDICRVLVLRPTTMADMRELRSKRSSMFRRVFITEHPDSPMWPFDRQDTAEISSWTDWKYIGPIFRRGSPQIQEQLRQKYKLDPARSLYVFSFGGGGVQESGKGDVDLFFQKSLEAAAYIRKFQPNSRLFFIRGPLFSSASPVPSIFEDYPFEHEMPSLLALARGAVIRPGDNTMWECIIAGTPFICVVTHTYKESVQERLNRLSALGLLAKDFQQWTDPQWIENFKQISKSTSEPWRAEQAAQSILDGLGPDTRKKVKPVLAVEKLGFVSRRWRMPWHKPLKGDMIIRVDDVAEINQELITLFELCAQRELHLSLEVIPYLSRLNDQILYDTVGNKLKFEVSQHGYDHLPRLDNENRKTEFNSQQDYGWAIEKGLRIIRQQFPKTFKGGFSAPFDVWAPDLCKTWKNLGGSYVSSIWADPGDADSPIVRLTIYPWDWQKQKHYSIGWTIEQIKKSLQERGYAGLVVYPQFSKTPSQIRYLRKLLDRITGLNLRPVLISEAALSMPMVRQSH